MANMFDYLTWRGDLSLSQSPFQDVDSLILSTMSYIFFDGIVAEKLEERITIREMAEQFLSRPQTEWKLRIPDDEKLLRALKESDRFNKPKYFSASFSGIIPTLCLNSDTISFWELT